MRSSVSHDQAVDCPVWLTLRVQAEIAEMLQVESIQDAVRIVPDIFWEAPEVQSGWQRAFAAILPLATLSPLWRR